MGPSAIRFCLNVSFTISTIYLVLLSFAYFYLIRYWGTVYVYIPPARKTRCPVVCSDVEYYAIPEDYRNRWFLSTVAILDRQTKEVVTNGFINVEYDRVIVSKKAFENLNLHDLVVRYGSYYWNYGGTLHIIDPVDFQSGMGGCGGCPKPSKYQTRILKVLPGLKFVSSAHNYDTGRDGQNGLISFNRADSETNPYARYLIGFKLVNCDSGYSDEDAKLSDCKLNEASKTKPELDLGGTIIRPDPSGVITFGVVTHSEGTTVRYQEAKYSRFYMYGTFKPTVRHKFPDSPDYNN